MRVRYDGDIPVGVPGVPIDWTPGLEAEVSADTGAYLLRNIHFHEVVPEPVPPVEVAVPVPVIVPCTGAASTLHVSVCPASVSVTARGLMRVSMLVLPQTVRLAPGPCTKCGGKF